MSDRYFTLTIRMENANMQLGEEVAEALRDAANYIEQHDQGSLVVDANGNVVGNFRYVDRETPDREAKAIVKGTFTFLDGAKFRDADVEEQSAAFIAAVIADTIRSERGQVR